MWKLLFNWPALVQLGADAVTYFIMATAGTILFIARLVMALFGGDGGDFDADADLDTGTDSSFTLFSLLSVTAFIMGTGWMGLACRIDWELGRIPSLIAAVGFGTTMMFLAAGLMYMTRKLNRTVHYDLHTAVGMTGRVYLNVPAKGTGQGQVEVSVSGRKKILKAVTHGKELAAFTDVRITDVRDDDTLIVEPLG
jgi:hypothetical protein